MKLKVLDLFSGIGGFSLGLERTGGFQTVAFCEIDPFCRKVLKKHWPAVPIFEDVRTLTHEQVGAVDVICGGFPCTEISRGGKKTGLTGASGLWSEFARLIGDIRPSYVIVENSSDIRSRGLHEVLGDLAEIGYDAEWHTIPAHAVGAPIKCRDRTWILAFPHTNGLQESGVSPQERTMVAKLARSLGVCDDASAAGTWWESEPALARVANGIPDQLDSIAALGNAVVPQIPEVIGRSILKSMEAS